MKKKSILPLLLALVILFVLGGKTFAAGKGITFNDILTDKSCKDAKGFVCGADVYPDFESTGLPPTFGIKKVPTLSIPSRGITGAKIIKQQMGKWENWSLQIIFHTEYGKKLKKYTTNKVGQSVALEIDGKVATVLPLASSLEKKIIITSTKEKVEEIARLLSTVYPQIATETQTSSYNTPVHQDAAPPRR